MDEVKAIWAKTKQFALTLHMDGARFANALAQLDCTPAELTWKLGVDVLSFGATKNGCICAEALLFFDPAMAADLPFMRKRAGHLFSKTRFVAAQFHAYFADGLWLAMARHANAMADRLRAGLAQLKDARLAWPTETNEVFAVLARERAAALKAAGAVFYDWPPPHDMELDGEAEQLVRLVTSFATSAEEVDRFVATLKS